ncbi:MAG TPA: hypothetical protein VHU80_03155 [Polyangiaceae bacterium]|nr:hypothetical protein [Polyangiaceae bacterium]
MHAVSKYLATWAEPETRLAASIAGVYERCLVVPACREQGGLLDGYVRAAATSPGRTLCVLVVNGAEDAPARHHAENAAFLGRLGAVLRRARPLEGTLAWFGEPPGDGLDVLVVDRASEGLRLPSKTGVGLARKIGMDIALALYVAGNVRGRLVFSTDADVALPEAHFDRAELARAPGAAVFPFWHHPAAELSVTRATALYELSLRYYVAGLAFAASPYAFHTLGSAMAIDAECYASVRGVPKREAGEDFYLLGKVTKVAPLVRTGGPALRIQSRESDRTPFGTGAGIARGLGVAEPLFYAPELFVALRRFLAALEELTSGPSLERFREARAGLRADEWDAVRAELFDSRGGASFEAAVGDAPSAVARRVRQHEWFDAFRTLKFIHALERRVWPRVPWRDALSRAPFAPTAAGGREPDDVDGWRTAFATAEAGSPAWFGPRAASAR